MIYVKYAYFRKSTNEWIDSIKKFDDCFKAKKFMWSLKYKKAFLYGYECDNYEDSEFLDYSVSLYKINYC